MTFKLNNSEIKNLDDLKQNFNIDEILKRENEFYRFASCYLAPVSPEKAGFCCEWFQRAKNCHDLPDMQASIFIQSAALLFEQQSSARELTENMTLLFSVYKSAFRGTAASMFIKVCAALLLAEMDIEQFINQLTEEKGQEPNSKSNGSPWYIFGKGSSFNLNYNREVYRFRYEPHYEMRKNDSIRTVSLHTTDPIKVCFVRESNEDSITLSLEKGSTFFVNVVGDSTVVAIHPTRTVRTKEGYLLKLYEADIALFPFESATRTITYIKEPQKNNMCRYTGTCAEPEEIPIPNNASSFVILNNNEYVYITNGKLKFFNCFAVNTEWYYYREPFVEVAADKNGRLMVLTASGRVLSDFIKHDKKVCSLLQI